MSKLNGYKTYLLAAMFFVSEITATVQSIVSGAEVDWFDVAQKLIAAAAVAAIRAGIKSAGK